MKRFSNLGPLSNDRFGLQTAYNMRKKALSTRPKSTDVFIQASSDVPELDPSIFTAPVEAGKVPSLMQILNQPLSCESGRLLPPKVKLISRRSLRCVQSDAMLYKGEYSPNVVKPRMQFFGFDFVPDIRISREVNIVPNQISSFFLVVSNNSAFIIKVSLKGEYVEEDEDCIDCSSFALDISIPSKDDMADVNEFIAQGQEHESRTINEKVTFTRRHRVGLCVECKPRESSTRRYAMFKMEFSHVPPQTITNENNAAQTIKVMAAAFHVDPISHYFDFGQVNSERRAQCKYLNCGVVLRRSPKLLHHHLLQMHPGILNNAHNYAAQQQAPVRAARQPNLMRPIVPNETLLEIILFIPFGQYKNMIFVSKIFSRELLPRFIHYWTTYDPSKEIAALRHQVQQLTQTQTQMQTQIATLRAGFRQYWDHYYQNNPNYPFPYCK